MHLPEHILDIFLQPGEFYWGDSATRIRTILGSCVSICFWHPINKEGGMCHYLLPEKPDDGNLTIPFPGRYADGAWELFKKEIKQSKTNLTDYHVKIFGGSSLFSGEEEAFFNKRKYFNIGEKNIKVAHKLIADNKLNLVSENVSGIRPRRIHFEIWSGNVWLKRI
jgi:chemotaxis protein CheD